MRVVTLSNSTRSRFPTAKMRRSISNGFVSLASPLLLSVAGGVSILAPAAAQQPDQSVIYLNQAWSQEDREWYYNFSQGSAVLSYDIFLNLEVAGGQDLFRSDANLVRYGLIPTPANRYNPDALPIGFSKTVVATPVKGWPAGNYVGMTCAACHEAQLDYKGKHVRIHGGVAHRFDSQALFRGIDDALQATLTDTAKFDRLATRLGASNADTKTQLRKRFESEAARVHEYASRDTLSPYPWGPGRIDALTLINNRLTATLTGIVQKSLNTHRTGQTAVPLEFTARHLDPVGRFCERSNGPQFRGDDGRLYAYRSDLQISRRRTVQLKRRHSRPSKGREPIGPLGAAQLARRCVRQN